MGELDHLAVVCRDLAVGEAWVEDLLGVPMSPGGTHTRFGTHNVLLGLGKGLYLEVIAPDPSAGPLPHPRWFGLDDAPAQPRLGNWIVRVPDMPSALAVAPSEVGPSVALTRGDLEWQLTVPADGSLPYDGAYPTLIAWGQGVPHPSATLPDVGARLVALEITHPDADTMQTLCASVVHAPCIRFAAGAKVLHRALIRTSTGEHWLG